MAARHARQRPGYALICAAVLAVGLGACTAVFSVLYCAILKPLPYPHPEQLVTVHNRFQNGQLEVGASPADYSLLRAHRELFRDAGAYYFLDLNLSGIAVPRKINAVAISSGLFDVLGAIPIQGRTFSEIEQRFNGPHAVILSESYWENEFARDPEILRRSLRLNGELYPVIGVMPKSFAFPNDVTQMWTPLALRDPNDSKNAYLRMYARLATGVDFERASAAIGTIGREAGLDGKGWTYFLQPVLRTDNAPARRWIWILFAAVGCLLLIVCSNVAGLLLVRALEQQSDIAIRIALGARRWRVARQFVVEVFVLASFGATGGLLIARAAIAALSPYVPAAVRMETPVYFFFLAAYVLTGFICGIAPALQSATLAEANLRQTRGHAKRRWQQALTVFQVAIATALFICGGWLIHSLLRLLETPLGFDPSQVITMQISLPPSRYATPESRGRFYDALLDQISALPGVNAAAGCTLLPFGHGEDISTFEIAGRPRTAVNQYADRSIVSARYFEAMRIPLVRGRTFSQGDRIETAPVVLVDESFARREFPGEDPVGRQIRMGWGGVYTIAGVVGSIKSSAIDVDSAPTLYFSAAQSPVTDLTLAIRTVIPDDQMVRAVERIVTSLDRDQPVYDIAPLQSRIDHSLKTRRFVVWLLLGFSAAGMALATLGLYGLQSFSVVVRRREIGVRMALGAGRGDIAKLICANGMTLIAGGLVLGAGAAIGVYRLIASQIYGVTWGDGATWFAVFAVVFLAGLSGSALPAWRATRTNPSEALK